MLLVKRFLEIGPSLLGPLDIVADLPECSCTLARQYLQLEEVPYKILRLGVKQIHITKLQEYLKEIQCIFKLQRHCFLFDATKVSYTCKSNQVSS